MNHVDEIAELKGIGAKAAGYTISQAAAITGLDRHVLYRAIKAGQLSVAKKEADGLSFLQRIKGDELQRWVDSL